MKKIWAVIFFAAIGGIFVANSIFAENKKFVDIDDKDIAAPSNPKILQAVNGTKIVFEQGYSYYIKNDYKNSLDKFKLCIKDYSSDPLSANCEYFSAKIYYNIEKYDLAKKHIRSILRNYPRQSPDIKNQVAAAIFLLANIHEDQHLIDGSRYYYVKLIELFPENIYAEEAKIRLGIK